MKLQKSSESNSKKGKNLTSYNACSQMSDSSFPPQNEKEGVFSSKSLKMYIPHCVVIILLFVEKIDNMTLAGKIILGYVIALVTWIIAAFVGYFNKKD